MSLIKESVNTENKSETKIESMLGTKTIILSKVKGLFWSPSPGISQVHGCTGKTVSCRIHRNRSNLSSP